MTSRPCSSCVARLDLQHARRRRSRASRNEQQRCSVGDRAPRRARRRRPARSVTTSPSRERVDARRRTERAGRRGPSCSAERCGRRQRAAVRRDERQAPHRVCLFSFPRLKLPLAFAISSCSSWPVQSDETARKFSASLPVSTVTRRPFQKIATEPSLRCRNVNGCSFSSTPRRSGVFFFGLTTPPAPRSPRRARTP